MSDDTNTAAPSGGGDADIVVTDRQLFDSAVQPEATPPQPSAEGSRPPEQEQRPPEQTPQEAPQPGAQPRNAQGQFARRPQGKGQQQQPGDHQVPLRTYLDEREQRYRIQAEHDQMRRAWENLQYQQQQAALLAQQQAMPKTIYDNPDLYLQHNVMQPLRNEGHMAMLSIKDGLSREMANAQFGEQNVNAALQAMEQVRHTPNGDHVFRQIMSSGHPYGQLVRWFNYARAQQQIGPDPQAWLQKQREAWMNDPQVQAEIMKRAQGQQQQQRQQRPGQPNVQLPPSLSSLPASSGRAEAVGDLSDASLYRFATR